MSNNDDGIVGRARERLSALVSTVSQYTGDTTHQFPAFDDVPRVPGQPQGCLWGFFDRDGVKDEVGSMLTQSP